MDLVRILKAIVNGPPRLAGELFRATKAPSIIILLLLGFLGTIVVFTVVYASSTHSPTPYYVLELGINQHLDILWGPNPARAHLESSLMLNMTPEQKQSAMAVTRIILGSSFVLSLAVLWWCFGLRRFISVKVRGSSD
jgi:hypothetical protein